VTHPGNQAAVEGSAAVTWLGHATVLIALNGVQLLTDPVLRDRIGPLIRVAPPVGTDGPGRLDAVLLSHLHADHTDLTSLRRLGSGMVVVAPHSAGSWLRRKGVVGVRELRPGDETNIASVTVAATRAIHDRRRRPFGPTADPIGYVVRGSRSVYFAGDTDLDPAMADLRGSIDVALIPIWGWGRSVGAGHLDPRRAALAVALIAPAVAIPIHWGTFTLRWFAGRRSDMERPAIEFAALARRHARGVEVRLLAPGERVEL
jgi:L-ascorbate metabolism protein UlaG (beta-lactamase superfamily)